MSDFEIILPLQNGGYLIIDSMDSMDSIMEVFVSTPKTVGSASHSYTSHPITVEELKDLHSQLTDFLYSIDEDG